MSSFREQYLEAFTDTISRILQTAGSGERELTQTDIILLRAYKKELQTYEKKPQYINVINTINAVLSTISGGNKQ